MMVMSSIATSSDGPSATSSGQRDEVSPAAMMQQLEAFLKVATNAISDGNNPVLTAEDVSSACRGLQLLRVLPPARPAVLAYIGHLLGKQVCQYVRGSRGSGSEGSSGSGGLSADLVVEVEEVLRPLLESEGDGGGLWCELVCTWGVEILAVWASEFGRLGGILEEVVSVWLNCGAVRSVVGLVALCVARDPQGTVAHVLNTASACAPVLDWLVAHIGASHPGPVLAYLLDPCVQVSLEPEHLDRTTAILSHLALQHSCAVGQALTSLLERAVLIQCWPGAGPQLLLLLTRSAPLLDTLTAALPSLLAPNTLNRLAGQVATWVPTYFRSWSDLQQICVQLLLDCAGPSLLHTLLHGLAPATPLNQPQDTPGALGELSTPHLQPIVRASLAILLKNLLAELCSLAYSRRSKKLPVSLLYSLGQPSGRGITRPLAPVFVWSLRCGSPSVVRAVSQLVVMSCSQQQLPTETGLWPYLVSAFPPGPDLLHIVSRLTLAIIREVPGNTLERPLASLLTQSGSSLVNGIANMQFLSSGNIIRAPICEAVLSLLPKLAQFINLPESGTSVIKLLSKITLNQPISFAHTSCMAHAITCHLMAALDSDDLAMKVTNAGHCGRLLSQLSSSSCGHGLVTRLIVEAVFRPEWAHIFGAAIVSPAENTTQSIKTAGSSNYIANANKQLLKVNYTFDSWVKLPQSHTTIFHAGAINRGGGRRQVTETMLQPSAVSLNSQLLLNALCSASKHHEHASLTIALLLVEIISPDIMYNGFPWPDENIKFTIERDLTIKKTLDDFPIAWELLEFVASNRPALCYCSVLVRALTASYIALWSTSSLSKSTESPKQLRSTERLLEIMVIGQFLPENMHVLPLMISELAPHEVVAVLQDVWNYMRDNTPSPDRWTMLPNRQHDRTNHLADPRSFDVCRRLVHFHVETLGHLLPPMLQTGQH